MQQGSDLRSAYLGMSSAAGDRAPDSSRLERQASSNLNMLEQDMWASRQPLMDFMTHDLDTTLPGMYEDIWWGIPQVGL